METISKYGIGGLQDMVKNRIMQNYIYLKTM